MSIALDALRLHGVEQELHAMDLALVLGGDVVDHLQIARLGALFLHRGPGRALQLDLVVPLGIMEGLGQRLLAFHLVVGLAAALVADVLVGIELGAEHPDFLGIVAGGLDVDFVGHLHHADVLAHLLDGFVTGARRLVEIELLEFPEVAVVVAVRRAEDVGARVERDLLPGQAVRQLHADFPRRVVAVELVLCGGEQRAALIDPGVVVVIAGVQQRARQPVEIVAHAVAHRRGGGVEPAP